MIEKVTKTILDYMLADPLRFLGFTVLAMATVIILQGLKIRRKEDEILQEKLKDIVGDISKLDKKIDSSVNKFDLTARTLADDMRGVTFEARDLKDKVVDLKLEIAKGLTDTKAGNERLQMAVVKFVDLYGKIVELKDKFEDKFGRVEAVEDFIQSLKKKKAP